MHERRVCGRRGRPLGWAALGVGCALGATASPAAIYTVAVLNTISGGTHTVAAAINNYEQVAGSTYGTAVCSQPCATIWNGTSPTLLRTLPGSVGSVANGLNDSGEVVGLSAFLNQPVQAVVWIGGAPTQLAPLDGEYSVYSTASAISNTGQIVGNSDSGAGQQAVVWRGTIPQSLGPSSGAANGINDCFRIVGDVNGTPVQWSGGKRTPLSSLGGGEAVAFAGNDPGEIVGYATTPSGVQHAVYWRGNAIRDLGTLGGDSSVAESINAEGNIVGTANTPREVGHAAFWSSGRETAVDLNSLIGAAEAAKILLTDAVGINDNCVILANGFDRKNGAARSFVLSLIDRSTCHWGK